MRHISSRDGCFAGGRRRDAVPAQGKTSPDNINCLSLTCHVESCSPIQAEADSPRVAAKRLVAAAAGASLGTLAALEELVAQLVHKELLPPKGAVVRALWGMVGASTDAPGESTLTNPLPTTLGGGSNLAAYTIGCAVPVRF